MKKILIFILLICLLSGSQRMVSATWLFTAHMQFCYNDAPVTDNHNLTNVGMFNQIMINCDGFPFFYSFDIRELSLNEPDNGRISCLPLTINNGISLIGNAQTIQYADASIEMIIVSKDYSYLVWTGHSKPFRLTVISIFYPNGVSQTDNGHPAAKLYALIEWQNGIPERDYWGQVSNAGIIVRTDWDPYFGSSYSGSENANGDYLDPRPYSVYLDPSKWGNASYKVFSRWFDTEWATRTSPTADVFWVEEVPTYGFADQFPAAYSDHGFYSMDDYTNWGVLYASQRGMAGIPGSMPEFIPAGKGKDLVNYCSAFDQTTNDYTNYQFTQLSFAMARQIGMRSLYMRWYYNNSTYGNPNYQVASGGQSHSIVNALTDLMTPASQYQDNDVLIGRFQRSLTCPNGSCTDAELQAIDYANYPETGEDFKRLNTAVYCLQENQHYYADNATTKVYGVTYAQNSRAFVFPGTCPSVVRAYFSIAHEMGHTLGMAHQFSNCGKYDNWDNKNNLGWNCNHGTIMSYSTNGIYLYGKDAQTWFKKAPFNWISPRWGYGPTSTDYKVGQMINW